jgi:hypothetical protein
LIRANFHVPQRAWLLIRGYNPYTVNSRIIIRISLPPPRNKYICFAFIRVNPSCLIMPPLPPGENVDGTEKIVRPGPTIPLLATVPPEMRRRLLLSKAAKPSNQPRVMINNSFRAAGDDGTAPEWARLWCGSSCNHCHYSVHFFSTIGSNHAMHFREWIIRKRWRKRTDPVPSGACIGLTLAGYRYSLVNTQFISHHSPPVTNHRPHALGVFTFSIISHREAAADD